MLTKDELNMLDELQYYDTIPEENIKLIKDIIARNAIDNLEAIKDITNTTSTKCRGCGAIIDIIYCDKCNKLWES